MRHRRQNVSSQRPTLANVYTRNTPYEPKNPKVERLHRLLVELFCKEAQPFRVVESQAFKAFVHELDPRYVLPSRHTLSGKLVPDLHSEVRQTIVSEVQKSTTQAITTDMWTSVNNESYMGVTAHWLDEAFHSHNACLAVKPVLGSHTADFITAELNTVIDDWQLRRSSLHIVTDNAANVRKAVSQVQDTAWRPCFAHTLQLCVNGALNAREVSDLPKIVAKARNIVSHFRRSPLATTSLEKAQQQLSLPQHKLQQDCPTRWNSQVRMTTNCVFFWYALSQKAFFTVGV